MTESEATRQLLRQGRRRLLVLSGEPLWTAWQAQRWIDRLPGDWLWVGRDAERQPACQPEAMRTLLGREFRHAVFDAREGFHAEALAALSGTLMAGSWLIVLVPDWEAWPLRDDADTLRWSESATPRASPHFIRRLQKIMLADARVVVWRQRLPMTMTPLDQGDTWSSDTQQQQRVLDALLRSDAGIYVVTAARGRGKSALAGMLMARWPGECLVTAPAKVSTDVLAHFAGERYNFVAPDRLLAEVGTRQADWLLIDEAAAIPAPVLRKLVALSPRILMTTTVQGYEGTGRGFMLKFCSTLPNVTHYQLDAPLRWAQDDPLEQFVDEALLLSEDVPPLQAGESDFLSLSQEDWSRQPARMAAIYRLLTSAHYRTSPLDLRRMMDAPDMHFIAAVQGDCVQGALWAVSEGGLSAELCRAVWAGLRRPRGNLLVQSLAAHAGLPEAGQLRSLRISRIAVAAQQRGRGCGQRLVARCRQQSEREGLDFLSVSFGFTDELWRFWQLCGFSLVRFGTQREASSGCFAAMAILPLSDAGRDIAARAAHRLRRDGHWLRQQPDMDGLPFETQGGVDPLNEDDWRELAGFAWAHRPFEASFAALGRLVSSTPDVTAPLLYAALIDRLTAADICRTHGLAGRKVLQAAWRREVAQTLSQRDPDRASRLRQWIADL